MVFCLMRVAVKRLIPHYIGFIWLSFRSEIEGLILFFSSIGNSELIFSQRYFSFVFRKAVSAAKRSLSSFRCSKVILSRSVLGFPVSIMVWQMYFTYLYVNIFLYCWYIFRQTKVRRHTIWDKILLIIHTFRKKNKQNLYILRSLQNLFVHPWEQSWQWPVLLSHGALWRQCPLQTFRQFNPKVPVVHAKIKRNKTEVFISNKWCYLQLRLVNLCKIFDFYR